MAKARQTGRSTTPISEQLAALADRVARIERQLAHSGTEPRSRVDTGSSDCRAGGLTEWVANWQAREARQKLIREFDAQEWREEMRRFQPQLDAMKRARLVRLNAFLVARGMEPEPDECPETNG